MDFVQVLKANPNHDASGEFSSSSGTKPLSDDEKEKATAALAAFPDMEWPGMEKYIEQHPNVDACDLYGKTYAPTYYEPSDKELAKFGRVESVPVDSITPGQAGVPREGLKAYINNMPDELPRLFNFQGRTFVGAGHTRIGAQILAGRTHVTAHILDLNDKGKPMKPSKKADMTSSDLATAGKLNPEQAEAPPKKKPRTFSEILKHESLFN